MAWPSGVRPGPEQDRLADLGLLLPQGFPAELPESAHRGELAVADELDEPVRVPSGESIELTVTGRHTGTGSPWPDRASFALEGRVRIIARVTPLDPGGTLGAVSGGELPRWIRPGESFTADVQVFAVGTFLEPLPPGRYQVELGLGQAGEDWFASGGDASTFTMEVRPAR